MSEGLARATARRILSSLLLLLFGVGMVPLLGTSYDLVKRSRGILKVDQKQIQLDKARSLSRRWRSTCRACARRSRPSPRPSRSRAARSPSKCSAFASTTTPRALRGRRQRLLYLSVVDAEERGAAGTGFDSPSAGLQRMLQQGIAWAMEGKAEVSHPVSRPRCRSRWSSSAEPSPREGEGRAQGVVLAIGDPRSPSPPGPGR